MQYGKLKKSQQNRDCLPEIATGAKRPRNDKSGSRCGWRSTREPAASMALRERRYRQTPARRGRRRAGTYVF